MKVMSVGLEGMRGHKVIVEADVRDEKEACVIIGLPDASIQGARHLYLASRKCNVWHLKM